MVEIAVSFSYKVNLQNYLTVDEQTRLIKRNMGVAYGGTDFFMSQKASCPPSEQETKSEALQDFCKRSVMKAVNAYIQEWRELSKPEPTKGRSGIVHSVPGPWMENTMDESGQLN